MNNDDYKTMTDNSAEGLIVVTQLPVIEEQLLAIKERFSTEADIALSLECTEETLQFVRQKRAQLTKVFNVLESKRKEAKKAILAPYDAFEQIYKDCVTDIYQPCDKKLADKIREVENGLKAQKAEEVKAYYEEYSTSVGIDFIPFERAGINITLTASKKALKMQASDFLDKVADDLRLIETQNYRDEILVEYKTSLNVSRAITVVSDRHKAIEAERAKAEEAEKKAESAAKAAQAIDRMLEADPISEGPKEQPIQAPIAEVKKYSVSFTVIGSLEKIKALKEFLVKGEYEYEQQ